MRWDLLVIAGLFLMAVGMALVSIPAGVIAFGAGLVTMGIVGAIVEARAHKGGPR